MDRIKIISHPANIALLREQFEPRPLPQDLQAAIYKPYGDIGGIEFVENKFMERYKWSGRWLLTNKYKDDPFVQWYDGYSKPESWLIYMGVVVKEMVLHFIKINENKMIYIDYPGISALKWDMMNSNFLARSCF